MQKQGYYRTHAQGNAEPCIFLSEHFHSAGINTSNLPFDRTSRALLIPMLRCFRHSVESLKPLHLITSNPVLLRLIYTTQDLTELIGRWLSITTASLTPAVLPVQKTKEKSSVTSRPFVSNSEKWLHLIRILPSMRQTLLSR